MISTFGGLRMLMLSQEMYDMLEREYGEYQVIEEIRRYVAKTLEKSGVHTAARAYVGMLMSAILAAMSLSANEEERHFGTVYKLLSCSHGVLKEFLEMCAKDGDKSNQLALADFLRLNWGMFQSLPEDKELDYELDEREFYDFVDDRLREYAPVCTYLMSNYGTKICP
jgi:hypothetical protein